MPAPLPARLAADGRTATWNPALTRAPHVLLAVATDAGTEETRRTLNSGRARVRDGERIVAVLDPEGAEGPAPG